MVKITECPRDAMQGLSEFIPTDLKIEYINKLLKANFDTIDFGSFVSPKAIPQMRDTADVLEGIDLSNSSTDLLAIVANIRGAESAVVYDEIRYLGYPFSISETFQMRNANSTIEQSLKRVEEINNLCLMFRKDLLIYISMAFGNPYNDKWHPDIVAEWLEKLSNMGILYFALADTVGLSNEENITQLFGTLIPDFSHIEIAAHLHSRPDTAYSKIQTAYNAGCRKFDSAIMGFGGCPMAEDKLVGNIATETLLEYFSEENIAHQIDIEEFDECKQFANTVFGS